MSVLWRLIVVASACLAASLAAGGVVALAVLMPDWAGLELGPLDHGMFRILVGFGAIFLSGFALLPALAIIAIAEAFAIRTVLFYAAGGAAVAALLYLNFRDWDTLALRVNGFARREIEIMAAAGIVAGFVYWAIAGRHAGAWRAAPTLPPGAPRS